MDTATLIDVTKIYGKQGIEMTALQHVNFSVRQGEFVLFLGPSGSGKTTLLTLLAGFQKPTSGRILLFDKDIPEYSPVELQRLRANHIGFIFQNFNLLACLTVRENIELAMKFADPGKKGTGKYAEELLNGFGIKDTDKYPDSLSQGEKQRVAVARALVNNAELVIADEPTGSLSTSQGNQIVSLLRESVDREQRTVIMVSHDDRIKSYADRVIHIKDGMIASD